jgi:hypothetical protein
MMVLVSDLNVASCEMVLYISTAEGPAAASFYSWVVLPSTSTAFSFLLRSIKVRAALGTWSFTKSFTCTDRL